jgi:hypothetical protein
MNPNQYQISKQQYEEFLKHLAWQRLKTPDYRFGQAFLNYFPVVREIMERDGVFGSQSTAHLFYEEWEPAARARCESWVSEH